MKNLPTRPLHPKPYTLNPKKMDVKVEKMPKSEVKIVVAMTDSEMKVYEERAAEVISKEVKIDGFRTGKAPINIVKKRVGDTAFESQVVDLALPEAYAKAMQQEKIEPVSRPKRNITKQYPLHFEATVAVMPDVELKDYSKIKVAKKEIKVTDKDVEEIIESLSKREATFKDVERAAKKGDRVEVDFAGFDKDGKELPNTSSKNHPVIIGDETLIPGFEDGLVGMKKGEKKKLNLTFPKEYHSKNFQGKKVTFDVTMNRIEERELPKLDDKFAEKVSGGHAKTLKQLKEDIKTNLMDVRTEEAEKVREEEFLEELTKKATIEIPESMIEDEIDFMLERSKQSMDSRGMDWDKVMEEQKAAGKDPRKDLRKGAEKQVTLRLALREVYKKENIEVADEDMKVELEKIAKNYPPEYKAAIDQMYAPGTENHGILRNQVRLTKVFKKYLG